MLLQVTETRYSLVKGERIVRFVSITQLRGKHNQLPLIIQHRQFTCSQYTILCGLSVIKCRHHTFNTLQSPIICAAPHPIKIEDTALRSSLIYYCEYLNFHLTFYFFYYKSSSALRVLCVLLSLCRVFRAWDNQLLCSFLLSLLLLQRSDLGVLIIGIL